MTVHFFYNYKDELIKKLKERYTSELVLKKDKEHMQAQLDEAEKLIKTYFSDNQEALLEIMEVSNGAVDFFNEDPLHIKLEIDKNHVEFKRLDMSIEIRVGRYDTVTDWVESEVKCYVVPGDRKCKIKKVGQVHDSSHFDENTINYYVREAFGHLLTHLK